MADPNDPTQNFIQTYGPLANDISDATGIDSAVVLGHIAHESGWGQSIGGNNPFGLTDGRGNKSQYLDIPGAAADYVKLLNSPRYAGVAKSGSPQQQIAALTQAGYGPGPVDAANHPNQASGQGYADAIAANAAKVRTAGFGMPPPPSQTAAQMTPDQIEALTNPPSSQRQMTPDQIEALTNPPSSQPPPTSPLAPVVPDKYAGMGNPMGDQSDSALPNAPKDTIQRPLADAGRAVIDAGIRGYQSTPNLLTPAAQWSLENPPSPFSPVGLLNSQVIAPAVHVANAGLGVMGGLGAMQQEFPYQIGNALSGPQLGRDLVGLSTAGLLSYGGEAAQRSMASPVGSSVQPSFDTTAADRIAAPLPRDFTGNPFAPTAEAKAQVAAPVAPAGVNPLTATPVPSASTMINRGAPNQGSVNPRNYYPEPAPDLTPAENTPSSPPSARTASPPANVSTDDTGMTVMTKDGTLKATKNPDDSYTLDHSIVADAGKGQGQRMALFEGAIDQAAREGVPFHASNVTDPATNQIYRDLQSKGYSVTRNPGTGLVETPDMMRRLYADNDKLTGNSLLVNDNGPTHTVDTSQMPPTPQSVGAAATPSSQAAISDAAAEKARLTVEQNILGETPADRANAQGWDTTQYVKDSVPTKAEYSGDPRVALEQRSDFENPDQAARWTAIDDSNDAARQAHYKQEMGSPTTTLNLRNQIKSDFAPRYNDLWANQSDVSAQPLVNQIDGVLSGPDGKNSSVKNALNNVKAKLYQNDDATSDLETAPDQLFGVRQEVARLLGSVAKRANPDLGDPRTAFHLGQLKDSLDDTIEGGAPGYKATQADYSTAMKPVNKQELLQSYFPDLTDNRNHMTLNKVQNMMEDIVEQRGSPGYNQAKSLSDNDMGKLWDLRNDLARRSNIDLGKARGSPTVQNNVVLNALTSHALYGASLPIHWGLMHYLGGPTGNLLFGAAQGAMLASKTQRAALAAVKARGARVNDYLTPPPGFGAPLTGASNDQDQSTQYAANEPPPPTPQPGSRPEVPMIPQPILPYQTPWYLRTAANESPPPTPQPGSRPEVPMIPQPILPYQTPWYLRTAANDLAGQGAFPMWDQPPDNDVIDRAPPMEDRLDANTVRNPGRLRGAKGLKNLLSRDT